MWAVTVASEEMLQFKGRDRGSRGGCPTAAAGNPHILVSRDPSSLSVERVEGNAGDRAVLTGS